MKLLLAVLALGLANFAFAQDSSPIAPEPAAKSVLEVRLTPHVPTETESLRWSPKAAKIELTKENDALFGTLEFAIEEKPRRGPGYTPKPSDGQRKSSLRLTRSKDAAHFVQLWIGAGSRGAGKTLTTTPSESRGEFWSSFETTLALPNVQGHDTRAYPLSFWFVEDPLEPDAAPVLRWSRRGWHAGEVKLGDDHPELKQRFGVEAFPTMILLDATGTELGRNVGYTGVDAMAAFLQQVP